MDGAESRVGSLGTFTDLDCCDNLMWLCFVFSNARLMVLWVLNLFCILDLS